MSAEDHVYAMFLQGDKCVAALCGLSPEQAEQGVPPHWASYVAVNDLEESLARVPALGGQILLPPRDIFEVGRLAVVRDPPGASLSLLQGKLQAGAQLKEEPVSLCWNELMTRDTGAADDFYRGLFDWDSRLSEIGQEPYTEFTAAGRPAAGMMAFAEGVEGVSPHWLPYFAVSEIDALASRARALGAALVVPPEDIPTVGRFAVIRDPQGAVFGVISLAVD